MKTRKQGMRRLGMAAAVLAVSSQLAAWGDEPTLFFISNSHLDTQWNWDVRTTINQYIKNTMTENFGLMDKYPNFMLNFEGSIRYKWMKEYYPDEYARLKKYIETGRWHVSGASVDANDVMVSSAESIMRNWLYGRLFFEEEFGVDGGNDIMLPDCFGFPYTLPSLAKHCGKIGFHSAKLGWGSSMYDRLPGWGIWKGVDGSQIYAVYKPDAYDSHEKYNKDMANDADIQRRISENKDKYGIAAEIRYVGPRSDHGGGLHDDANSSGDNTPYWLNRSVDSEGPVKVKLATPDEIFRYLAEQDNTKVNIYDGELPMRNHGVGAYTSQAVLKRWNRKNELLADAAEKASVAAEWLGASAYPREALRDAWVTNLWQAHHDGITGTSIPKAYVFSQNEYTMANKAFGDAFRTAVGAMTRALDTKVEGTPIVVYNPLSINRNDVAEATIPCGSKPAGVRVFDGNGNEVLAQVTGYNASRGEATVIFAATVPSLGCAVFDVRLGEECTLGSDLTLDESKKQISNGRYRTQLNSSGEPNLYDVANNRLVMGATTLQMLDDESNTWPAWEVLYNSVAGTPTAVDENVEITLAEDGPLRKAFRVYRTKNGSTFVQYIRMNALSDRVEVVNEVDWQSMETLLKLNVPVRMNCSKATYDLSLGTIERGQRTSEHYEMQGHQWADLTADAGTHGVSIINDCKYGWDMPGSNSLRLTLIHTPRCDSYTHHATQDIGDHHFTVAYFPHEGKWSESTQIEASKVNQPLMAFVAPKHDGAQGREFGFARLSTDKVAIKALKKAERSDEYIVRVYEWTGERQENVGITFPSEIVSAREVNGLEENFDDAAPVTTRGARMIFSIDRYSPKTFAVKLKDPDAAVKLAAVNETYIDLAYDTDMMSLNSKRKDVTSGIEAAYPGELVADVINHENVSFRMGGRGEGEMNALGCKGQTLQFTRKPGQDKLYILAASTNKNGSKGEFGVGNGQVEIPVAYNGGYVGQANTSYNFGSQYRKDNVALSMSHSHKVSDGSDDTFASIYIYKYVIDLPENVTSVTLPSESGMYIFAATLSDNAADDTKAATEIYNYPDYIETGSSAGETDWNYLTPDYITQSGQVNSNEAGKCAADRDTETKWCCTSANGWLEYRFNSPVEVSRWKILNAGCEGKNKITRSFKVQYYDNGTWKTIESITGNTENIVDHVITPVTASRFRLQIGEGEQGGVTARIYEFGLYGRSASGVEGISLDNRVNAIVVDGNYPNPCRDFTKIRYTVPEGVSDITLAVFDLTGKELDHQILNPGTSAGEYVCESQYVPTMSAGMYLCRLQGTLRGSAIYSNTFKLIVK